MFVDDIVKVFPTFADQEAQECLREDFAELGAAETVRSCNRAVRILEAYVMAAEAQDLGLYIPLCEALSRTKQARRVAEGYTQASATTADK